MLEKNFERLNSGKKLNRASDNAANMAILKQLEAELRSLGQASNNIDYGVSMSQVADGAMSSQGEIVSRMRELAVQSANGALNGQDRQVIQTEFDQLRSEVDRIGATTEFNAQPLLDGSVTTVQVGTGASDPNRINIPLPVSDVGALGLGGVDLSTEAGAQAAIENLDTALEAIANSRAAVGSTLNRLEFSQENLQETRINVAAASSRVGDTDYAKVASEGAVNVPRLWGWVTRM